MYLIYRVTLQMQENWCWYNKDMIIYYLNYFPVSVTVFRYREHSSLFKSIHQYGMMTLGKTAASFESRLTLVDLFLVLYV